MQPGKWCRMILYYDLDMPSIVIFTIISSVFLIEAFKAILSRSVLASILGIAAATFTIIIFWPSRRKGRIEIDYQDNERLMLQLWAGLVFKNSDSKHKPCYLVITNQRLIFYEDGHVRENIFLKDIRYIQSRSRLFGIERWIRIITAHGRDILITVRNPKCLHQYIDSIIADLHRE